MFFSAVRRDCFGAILFYHLYLKGMNDVIIKGLELLPAETVVPLLALKLLNFSIFCPLLNFYLLPLFSTLQLRCRRGPLCGR